MTAPTGIEPTGPAPTGIKPTGPTPTGVPGAVPAGTCVAAELVVRGRITGREDVAIAGHVVGTIELAGHLHVEAPGIVEADVVAIAVTIDGTLVGDVAAERSIALGPSARVVGKLSAPRIRVDAGAQYRGAIEVGAPEAATHLPARVEAPTERPSEALDAPSDTPSEGALEAPTTLPERAQGDEPAPPREPSIVPVASPGASPAESRAPTQLEPSTPEPVVPGTSGAETIVPRAAVHQALTVIRPVDAAALEGAALGATRAPGTAPDSVLPAPELATQPPAGDPPAPGGEAPKTTIGALTDAKSAVPDSSYSEWISSEPVPEAAPVEVAKATPVPEAPKKRRIIVRRRS